MSGYIFCWWCLRFKILRIPWSDNKLLLPWSPSSLAVQRLEIFKVTLSRFWSLVPATGLSISGDSNPLGFSHTNGRQKNIHWATVWCLTGVRGERRRSLIGGKCRSATVTRGRSLGKCQVHRLKSSKCRRNVLAKDLWRPDTCISVVYWIKWSVSAF